MARLTDFHRQQGYKPLKGGFGRLEALSIGRMPGNRNLLSLDVSLAIPTRVLRFEDSGLRCRTPVRPVLLTGQTGQTHRSDRSSTAAAPSSVLGFMDQPRNPVVFW
jgi:hypothetical protein